MYKRNEWCVQMYNMYVNLSFNNIQINWDIIDASKTIYR